MPVITREAVAYALKAKDPDAVTAWHAKREAELAEFNQRLRGYSKIVGTPELIVRQSWSALHVDGYINTDTDTELPAGWRRDRSHPSHIVPALKSKAGRENHATLAALRFNIVTAPGLPDLVFGGNRMGQFHVEHFDGDPDWYATLRFVPGDASRQEVQDSGLWEEVPLSGYYAAAEAMVARHESLFKEKGTLTPSAEAEL